MLKYLNFVFNNCLLLFDIWKITKFCLYWSIKYYSCSFVIVSHKNSKSTPFLSARPFVCIELFVKSYFCSSTILLSIYLLLISQFFFFQIKEIIFFFFSFSLYFERRINTSLPFMSFITEWCLCPFGLVSSSLPVSLSFE